MFDHRTIAQLGLLGSIAGEMQLNSDEWRHVTGLYRWHAGSWHRIGRETNMSPASIHCTDPRTIALETWSSFISIKHDAVS